MKHKKVLGSTGLLLFYLGVFLVFIAPIVRLLFMSLKGSDGYGLSNYQVLLQEKRTREAIFNTILIAASSTMIAIVAGSGLALAAAYTNIKRKRLLELLVLLPFIIPSYIITLSWSGFLSKKGIVNQILGAVGIGPVNIYSIGGILLVIGICNIPVVYMSVIHMLRRIPRDLEWASRACGFGLSYTLIHVDLVQVLPAIIAGGLLAFLSAIDNFSVPAFLGISSGIPVLSTYIYEKAIGFGPDAFPLAAALSVLLSVIAVGGTLMETALVGKNGKSESIKEDYSVRIELEGPKRRLLEWGLLGTLGVLNLVPILVMIKSAFLKTYGLKMTLDNLSFKNFAFVFTNRGVLAAVRNSILLALVTCGVCIVVGTTAAYMKVRRNSKGAVTMEKCASLTYAIPGIVLSLAMIVHWVEPLPGIRPGVYGTIWILVIAYITRYLILQIKESTTALMSVNPELEEAVRACGRGKRALWQQVLLPMLVRPILSGSFLIFVSSLTELTLSSMLASAGTKTIGLTIFNFQQSGDYNLSAAMSAVIVVMVLTGYCLVALKPAEKKKRGKEHESLFRAYNPEVRANTGA